MPGVLSRLSSLVPDFRPFRTPAAAAPSRRPRPDAEEKLPVRSTSAGDRTWFLPYQDATSTDDSPEIRSAMRLMLRDPYVKSAWLTQVLSVLSQPFQVHTPKGRKGKAAQEQADFVRACLEHADDGMLGVGNAVLLNLGSDGYSVSEKVWQVPPRGRYANKLTLKALKPKDVEEHGRLVGDRFNNVTGVYANATGDTYPITDFVYCRYLHTFDEPCGMAAFRPSYGAYWSRDTVRKLRIIHKEKNLDGLLMGTFEDPADKGPLETALARARNSTWLSVPSGVKVDLLNKSAANDADYKSFDESLREEILVGIALAHLHILQGGVSDARGDTKVHKAVADLGPWLLTYIVQYAVNRQIIPDLIDYNYAVADEYPTLTLGGVSNQEAMEVLSLLEGAQRAGFNPSRSYYATEMTIQEADPADPADQLAPPQQPGMGGYGMGGDPSGGMGGGFGPPPAGPPPALPPGLGAFGEEAGGWEAFGWDDWTAAGDRMVSPSGKRKLMRATWERLRAATGTGGAGTTAAATPHHAAVRQAVADWKAGRAIIGRDDRYRLRATGEVAPWSDAAKRHFASIMDLHQAARTGVIPQQPAGREWTDPWAVASPGRRVRTAAPAPIVPPPPPPPIVRPGPAPAPPTTARADPRALLPHDPHPARLPGTPTHGQQADKLVRMLASRVRRPAADLEAVAATLPHWDDATLADAHRKLFGVTWGRDPDTGERVAVAPPRAEAEADIRRRVAGWTNFRDFGCFEATGWQSWSEQADGRWRSPGDRVLSAAIFRRMADRSNRLAAFVDAPSPQPGEEIALAGRDGKRAAELMGDAQRTGREVLATLTEKAVARLLADPHPLGATVLFDDAELQEIADSLAATTAAADLLGRARVRRLAHLAEHGAEAFAEGDGPDPFDLFQQPPPALPPVDAVGYFRRLVPTLGVDPQRYGPLLGRNAFTLAVAADQALLGKVKGIIQDQLAAGGRPEAVADIQDALDAAGVSPRNPSYAEMTYRTNMNDAFMQGQSAELADPDMHGVFPAWEYHAIVDGRERPTHGEKNGKLYPSTAAFAEVRGTGAGDTINCRCSASPVTRVELQRRLDAGEKLEEGWSSIKPIRMPD